VFELDRPEVLRLKEELLTGPARCRRVPVGVDLAANWTTPLLAAGFAVDRATCWLIEGLVQYLTEADVLRLLDRVTELSAPGSEMMIDFVGQSLLDSPALRPMLDWFADRGMTWHYGTDQPEELLTSRGWRPEVTLVSDVGNKFNRWPYPSAPRGTPGMDQGYFVTAIRPEAE
jgi:methyltransferase (TIGR00027 family)